MVLHPWDLTLAGLRQKVDGLLPFRDLDGHEPLVAFLEAASRGYRRNARPEFFGSARPDSSGIKT